MKNEFTKLLLNFFTEADNAISDFTPPTRFHEFYVKNGENWVKTIKKINDWNYPKLSDEIFKRVKVLKEIEPCLNMLEIIFKPKTFSRTDANDKRPYTEEETKKANRNSYTYELTKLFFRFKEKKEIDSNITIESFSKAMSDFAFSNENVTYFRAYLIGFRSKDIEKVDFGEFSIRKLHENEKLKMMNNFNGFFSLLSPLIIVHGFDDAWIYNHWITGEIKTKMKAKRSTFFHVYTDDSFYDVEKQIMRILKLLRVGSGIDVGIRNFFAKSAYPDECPIYDDWSYQKYGFGNYAVFGRKEIEGTSRQFNLSRHTDYTKKHIDSVKSFYDLDNRYKELNLKQLDQAIEYYTNAFDQNFTIYRFTSLLMAFESLLNGKDKKTKLSKEERLNLLDKVSENIKRLTSPNKIKKEWNKLNPVNGITKAITIGKKIFTNETNAQKVFYQFFNPENGCYKLRNDLLHGNYNNDIEENIAQLLPQLSSFVRGLILKIIELRINGELICNEANYYEKIEKLANKK